MESLGQQRGNASEGVVWNRSLGRAGGWRDGGSARHSVRGSGEMFPQSPPNPRSRFPSLLCYLSAKRKMFCRSSVFSSVSLADVLLRDNGVVRKHLS